jgi:hypothetical protein
MYNKTVYSGVTSTGEAGKLTWRIYVERWEVPYIKLYHIIIIYTLLGLLSTC